MRSLGVTNDSTMPNTPHNPASIAAPEGHYSHAIDVAPGSRYLFISGQIPVRSDGYVPDDFESQCRTVWDNIDSVLASAGLGSQHLVKITTFLASANYAEINGRIRRERLGILRPALTVVVVALLEPRWLLEIEAIAASSTPSDRDRGP